MPRITIRSINEKIDNLKPDYKRRITVKILFLIIFSIVSIWSWSVLYYGDSLYEYIPFNVYNYEFSTSELSTLRDLKIYHDFSRNVGNISFMVEKEDYKQGSYIVIDLPRVIDSDTIKTYYWNKGDEPSLIDKWKNRITKSGTNHTQLILEDFSLLNGEDTFYSVSYGMEMSPSGHFTFHHPNTNLYGFTATVAFDLGKEYQCSAPCIDNLLNIMPRYLNTAKEIRLEFERTENNFHAFILRGIKDVRKKQGIFLGLFVSLAMSSLLLSKDIVEELFCERKDPNDRTNS